MKIFATLPTLSLIIGFSILLTACDKDTRQPSPRKIPDINTFKVQATIDGVPYVAYDETDYFIGSSVYTPDGTTIEKSDENGQVIQIKIDGVDIKQLSYP